MTQNQIAYQRMLTDRAAQEEQARHNVVSEIETERSNKARETETNRTNVSNEQIKRVHENTLSYKAKHDVLQGYLNIGLNAIKTAVGTAGTIASALA